MTPDTSIAAPTVIMVVVRNPTQHRTGQDTEGHDEAENDSHSVTITHRLTDHPRMIG